MPLLNALGRLDFPFIVITHSFTDVGEGAANKARKLDPHRVNACFHNMKVVNRISRY